MQRGHIYAIVDEVDSILIDEARTPLIIAVPATVSSHQYDKFKGTIERVVQAQNLEANRWAADAKKHIDEGKIEEAGRLLFKIKNSTPQNKQLLKMIEDPSIRRAMDDAELALYQDPRKDGALRAEGGGLFQHRSEDERIRPERARPDLSQPGRSGGVRAARFDHALSRHRRGSEFKQGREAAAESERAAEIRPGKRAHPQHLAVAARLLRFREGRPVRGAGQQGGHRRREYRPDHAGPALERRAAPGDRGEGRRADRSRDRRPWRQSRSRIISGFTTSCRG